jgi:hypothetical protein
MKKEQKLDFFKKVGRRWIKLSHDSIGPRIEGFTWIKTSDSPKLLGKKLK